MNSDELRLCVPYRNSLRNLLLAQQKVEIFRHAAAQLSLMHFFIAKSMNHGGNLQAAAPKNDWGAFFKFYETEIISISLVSMFMKTKHESASCSSPAWIV